MAIIKRQITYRCYDDCKQSGCPTHEATLEVQTTSQAYTFNLDGRELYCPDYCNSYEDQRKILLKF